MGEYLDFYRKFLLRQWADMSPMEYGTMLVLIGVFGWILMKSSTKR